VEGGLKVEHNDVTSTEGTPQGDCKDGGNDTEGTPPGEGLLIVEVEDVLEVKLKTFCAAFLPW